jgi:hypothetical protein
MRIKPLDDFTLVQRIVAMVIIVIVVLFLLTIVGCFMRDDVEAQPLPPSKWDTRINTLEREAIEEAFKKHIMQLYSVWVSDQYVHDIPPKALKGARNARDAFIRSMEAIEKRESK